MSCDFCLLSLVLSLVFCLLSFYVISCMTQWAAVANRGIIVIIRPTLSFVCFDCPSALSETKLTKFYFKLFKFYSLRFCKVSPEFCKWYRSMSENPPPHFFLMLMLIFIKGTMLVEGCVNFLLCVTLVHILQPSSVSTLKCQIFWLLEILFKHFCATNFWSSLHSLSQNAFFAKLNVFKILYDKLRHL